MLHCTGCLRRRLAPRRRAPEDKQGDAHAHIRDQGRKHQRERPRETERPSCKRKAKWPAKGSGGNCLGHHACCKPKRAMPRSATKDPATMQGSMAAAGMPLRLPAMTWKTSVRTKAVQDLRVVVVVVVGSARGKRNVSRWRDQRNPWTVPFDGGVPCAVDGTIRVSNN